jgi:hypothetical protein
MADAPAREACARKGMLVQIQLAVPVRPTRLMDRMRDFQSPGQDSNSWWAPCVRPWCNGSTPAFGVGDPGSKPGGRTLIPGDWKKRLIALVAQCWTERHPAKVEPGAGRCGCLFEPGRERWRKKFMEIVAQQAERLTVNEKVTGS